MVHMLIMTSKQHCHMQGMSHVCLSPYNMLCSFTLYVVYVMSDEGHVTDIIVGC